MNNNMKRLEGKVAIITGTSSGMGRSEAEVLAREGAKIVICARRENLLEECAEKIKSDGGEVTAVVADVSKEEDWKKLTKTAIENYGKIDILVNNAGFGSKVPESCLGSGYDREEWERVLATNLFGEINGMNAVIPYMQENGGGSIVNCGSMSALRGMGANAYTASKGAIHALTRAAAAQYGKDHIRINVIVPGIIDTGLIPFIKDTSNPRTQAWLNKIKLNQFGKPEEVANTVLFLVSDESSYITGEEIIISGGYDLE